MTGLARLTGRKEALMARSAANREILLRESQNLRRVASYVDLGIQVAGKARAGMIVVAALFAFRQKGGQRSSGLIGKLARGIGLASSVSQLWREWRGRQGSCGHGRDAGAEVGAGG